FVGLERQLLAEVARPGLGGGDGIDADTYRCEGCRYPGGKEEIADVQVHDSSWLAGNLPRAPRDGMPRTRENLEAFAPLAIAMSGHGRIVPGKARRRDHAGGPELPQRSWTGPVRWAAGYDPATSTLSRHRRWRIEPLGDRCLVVEFEQKVDVAVNRQA